MAKKTKKAQTPDTSIYLNPLTDFGFKKIFGDKELLIDFLNEIIQGVHIT
ncbi:MAG: Rpn family recombination-promoting nuclease/putative transposase, partial [Tannerella sp.]|nr:Rpn family recombination-promoting nuclease/putative transposase [Tannerella sp.]